MYFNLDELVDAYLQLNYVLLLLTSQVHLKSPSAKWNLYIVM